ncbi:hypothetical protein [Rhizobium sp. CECT 9324]|uniref:hypothetical protein n=1 Tax=Rhizobium sp. CECT 9324 TaxID=2845820 RepID=UPI001E5CB595|nr:hypothetical protein [Rhizobium sp. CECT 9324]
MDICIEEELPFGSRLAIDKSGTQSLTEFTMYRLPSPSRLPCFSGKIPVIRMSDRAVR